jgi:hypothetical protein
MSLKEDTSIQQRNSINNIPNIKIEEVSIKIEEQRFLKETKLHTSTLFNVQVEDGFDKENKIETVVTKKHVISNLLIYNYVKKHIPGSYKSWRNCFACTPHATQVCNLLTSKLCGPGPGRALDPLSSLNNDKNARPERSAVYFELAKHDFENGYYEASKQNFLRVLSFNSIDLYVHAQWFLLLIEHMKRDLLLSAKYAGNIIDCTSKCDIAIVPILDNKPNKYMITTATKDRVNKAKDYLDSLLLSKNILRHEVREEYTIRSVEILSSNEYKYRYKRADEVLDIEDRTFLALSAEKNNERVYAETSKILCKLRNAVKKQHPESEEFTKHKALLESSKCHVTKIIRKEKQ